MTERRFIRWADPPPTNYGKGAGRRIENALARPDPWEPVADLLRAHPGRWAVIVETDTQGSIANLTSTIKRGATRAWHPPGAFDACVRKAGDVTTVYARYIGDEGAA